MKTLFQLCFAPNRFHCSQELENFYITITKKSVDLKIELFSSGSFQLIIGVMEFFQFLRSSGGKNHKNWLPLVPAKNYLVV